jgi:hypothetical protein
VYSGFATGLVFLIVFLFDYKWLKQSEGDSYWYNISVANMATTKDQ